MKSRLGKVWATDRDRPSPLLQLRKLIAKLYGLSPRLFLPRRRRRRRRRPSSRLTSLFSLLLPIRRRRIPPRFTASFGSGSLFAEGLGAVDSTETQKADLSRFPFRQCHLNQPGNLSNLCVSPRIALSPSHELGPISFISSSPSTSILTPLPTPPVHAAHARPLVNWQGNAVWPRSTLRP